MGAGSERHSRGALPTAGVPDGRVAETVNTPPAQGRTLMGLDAQTEMTASAIDTLLERHETGVLALARAGDPYAVPISYGFEPDDRVFFFRLVSTPESDKRRFLTTSPRCRLVVYEEEPPIYRSVLAGGRLEVVERDDLTSERIAQYGRAKRPLFEIWAEPTADLEVQLFRLAPADISGRRIDVDQQAR